MSNDNPYSLNTIEAGKTEPGSANPFALASIEEQEHRQQRAALVPAVKLAPDTAARANILARSRGLPPDVVARNLPEVQAQDTVEKSDSILAASPALAALVRNVPGFAASTHDDLPQLGLVETLANSLKRGVPSLRQSGSAMSITAAANALQQLDRVEQKMATGQLVTDADDSSYSFRMMSAAGRSNARQKFQDIVTADATAIAEREAEKRAIPQPAAIGEVKAAFDSGEYIQALGAFMRNPATVIASIGGESLVTNLPSLAATTVMPGGALVKAATLGTGSGLTDYSSQILEGLQRNGVDLSDPAAVAKAAQDPVLMRRVASESLRHAGVVGAVDGLSGGVASKLALPGKAAAMLSRAPVARELANMAAQVPVQGAMGAAGEAAGELASGQPLDPFNIFAEAVGEAFHAPAEVASIAAGRVRERMHEATQAKAAAQQVEQLAAAAKASKLHQRDPAALADFGNQATSDTELFIDAKTFAQSIKPEQLAKLPEAVRAQLPEALATGGDVAIKAGDYAAHLGDVPTLAQHVRVGDPEAMTAAEAAEHKPDDDMRAEIAKLMPAEQVAPQDAATEARQAVLDQLQKANRFTKSVNEQYADLIGAFVATGAQRFGLDVEGVKALIPRIVSQLDLDGPVLAQTPVAETQAFRQWFGGSKVTGDGGQPLRVFHGTSQGVPEAFSLDKLGEGHSALGLFFTDSPREAGLYASSDTGGSAVMPVFLRLENPFVMTDEESADMIDRGITTQEATALRERLQAEGYDGIEIRGGGVNNYVAFAGAQVKSPFNAGAWARDDERVLHQGGDDRRGAFDTSNKTIALLQKADLSTFLHETGHFFLDTLMTQAARPDAPAGVKADAQALLDSFGVADVAAWQAMTLDEQREAHETFARGFERYLGEGKAPSAELQSAFARFASWLKAVYKKLSNLDVKLSPEVRGVMDRLLASDDQIRDTEARRNLEPLFASAEAAGMTPEQFSQYQATGAQATQDAVEHLQGAAVRDLAYIASSKARAVSKLNAEAKKRRAQITEEATAEVYAIPVVAAYRDLVRGHTQDGQPVRLSRADVEQSHPELVARLPQTALANSERALPADMVAEAYGMSSGDQLIRNLAAMDKPETIIEGLVDQRMLERHGELIDERAVHESAHAAIANDARSRILTTEANHLAAAIGNKPLIARAAREFAAQSIAQRKVRELRPSQYTAAESRAGAEAAKAFKAGKLAEAAQAKRTQVLQHQLGRATVAAKAEVERAVDYLSRFDSTATRQAIDPSYLDQIDQLLESVDLRVGVSLKSIDKRKSLAQWVAAQEEAGFSPVVDERLLTDAKRQSYKDMTVEELRGLVDTVKNIDHIGRLKEKLLTARDDRLFADVVAQVAGGIIEHGGKLRPVEIEGEKGVKFWLQGALASTRKLGSLAYRMDGAKDSGPMFEALVRPMNDAGTKEAVLIEQATVKLAEIYAPIEALKGGTTGAKIYIPEINASLSRGGRLAIALNWGNEGNRQRLKDGDHWSDTQVQAILRTLSPTELHAVNEAHAYIDSFWPQIKAQQLRVSGVVEDKVEATPWTATASDGTLVQMTGGYYPAKYDTARSAKAEQHDAAQIAKDMLGGAYVRATTRRGFTKARAEEVVDRPLRKDLGVLTQHVNEVVHNLAWQEWLIDANRLLRAAPVDGAIRGHYGPAIVRTMKDDLQGIAVGETAVANDIEKGMLWLRSNMTRATLGASFTTALMQPFGLSNSIARIGAAPVLRGMARWAGDAARMESSMTWVAEKSDFMRLRSKQFNRELSEISGRLSGKSKTMQMVDAGLMFMTVKAQQVVDIPTWIGRYEQATAQGLDEAAAIAQADEAVLSSQGGGQTKDLAQVQRDHKLLTSFFSYFSTTANLIAAKTGTTDFKSPAAVAGWLADMSLLAVIPALGPAVLKSMLSGGGGDDGEGWAKFLAKQQAGYMLSMLPLVRELSGLASGFPYTGPPLFRIFTDAAKLAQQGAQGEIDEPAVLAMARFLGDVTGLPTTQITRSYKGWEAWAHGNAPVSSILFGPPPKK